MPTKTFTTGILDDDANMLVKCTDAVFPFLLPHGQYRRKFVEGVDYDSGDDIVINFPASDSIDFVIGISQLGAVKAFAIADIGGGVMGKKVTFSAVDTAELMVYAIISI